MFSLIITIVSIALVVALVAATMYHGGDTLTQGRVTADAAAFVSGAQQVGGAATMYLSLEGSAPADVAALVTKSYLASAPVVKGDALSLAKDTAGHNIVKSANVSDAVCEQINKSAGVAAAKQKTAAEGDFASLAYGCVIGATDAENTFQFKY